MPLLQQPIQKKLSSLLGAQVTFEKLQLSILSGSIEASGMTVSAAADMPPVLKVARLSAQVAVTRALRGEVVVSSLKIEKPVVTIFRRGDGTMNLPRRAASAQGRASATDRDNTDAARWQLDAEAIEVLDGVIHLIDQSAEARYAISASPSNAHLRRAGGGYELSLDIGRIERADSPASIGALRARGRLGGAANLSGLATASLDAQLQVDTFITAKIRSNRLDSKAADLECHGSFMAEHVLALLPPALVPARLANLRGQFQLDAAAHLDHQRLAISELILRGTQIDLIG